ncbi:MAG: AAA family ATPase [Acidimicrobiaceae bacterium]|nr:AAA family ATPase [Acidimicrobiia bacterium]MCY4492608.1 AAA family ATPase [Acidimicrobiaceae bacterium]
MSQRHPELEAEQAHLNAAYSCLDDSRERVRRITEMFEATRGGTNQARFERESVLQGALNRLSRLNLGNRSLVFGRIDPAGTGERFYIGRVGVWDDDQNAVVVDWRAPVSEPFYRATGREPLGLERRRFFATRGRTLLGIDDELFGELADPDHTSDAAVRGEGALIAALEAARTGRLGDIVATIQAEQDEIIRAPMPGLLVVQGGPGTGKTVVALHRAAYLLYTHRLSLESQGVLVVAPNRLFIAYIEQVLPSLGESGVTIAVLADLVQPRVRVDRLDDEGAARVKGDPRMVEVLATAVSNRQRRLRTDQVFGFGLQRLRITVAGSARIVAVARRRSRTHNAGRKIVEDLFFETLAESARKRVDPQVVRERMRNDVGVRETLDWMWPVLTPAHLLHDLLGSQALLKSANRGAFSEQEILRLHRPRSSHADEVVWSFEDVPLLDEARALLGARPGKRAVDAVRTYGHICIDEAQDLSPMELRMVARRSLNGSLTVVGDIAQATGAWANSDWGAVTAAFPSKHEPRIAGLSVGYRIPGPTMMLANKILPFAAPGLRPPRPVRSDGDDPQLIEVRDSPDETLVGVVSAELAKVGEGNVAVIVPVSLLASVTAAFAAHELPFGGPTRHGLDQRVTVVPVRLVKGLEVDAAVVVEPRRIVDEETCGFRSLYVALTRATKRVTVVCSEPLPELLG